MFVTNHLVGFGAGGTLDLSNQIPTMTSNTTPSGMASASSEETVSEEAWKAFDRDNATAWQCHPSDSPTATITYQFASAKIITRYTLRALAASAALNRMPTAWTLLASNTGAFSGEEVTLDTQSGLSWSLGEQKSFSFSTSTAYTHFRISTTANGGGAYINIAEIEMFLV